jgi:hypothetical protein
MHWAPLSNTAETAIASVATTAANQRSAARTISHPTAHSVAATETAPIRRRPTIARVSGNCPTALTIAIREKINPIWRATVEPINQRASGGYCEPAYGGRNETGIAE